MTFFFIEQNTKEEKIEPNGLFTDMGDRYVYHKINFLLTLNTQYTFFSF